MDALQTYEVIKNYLLERKIASTSEEVNAIILNMEESWFEEILTEEDSDKLKDRRMERGGVGGNQRYNKPVSNTPNTFGKKPGKKYDGMSAVEKVRASIEKQYGKGAIMDTKKKKKN